MKRLVVLACCILCAASTLMAQNSGAISATLKDAVSGEGINGAVVELTNLKTQKQLYYTSGYQGVISIKNLAPATYKMVITYLGYKDHTQEVKVGSSLTKLGTIRFKQDAKILEDIQIKGYMGTSQKGDTVSYNASAFKTARDASAEGLLKKMPGITVNHDGSVDAQGESVQKVYVDGKEFFGEDVSTTIKTIPAEMISKVEVYDKLSDKAEFTGLDDGEGFKALNIVTKLGKRKGIFGKLYGSYGYPDLYSVGGNVNRFNGDEKLSVIAMANNINQLNFSFEDIVGATSSGKVASSRGGGGGMGGYRQAQNFMVSPMSGISTVQSVGLNYANQWKKLELQGSYFFNHSNTINEQTEERTTYAGDYTQLYNESNSSDKENWNHRLNLRADYKFSKTQSLMLRANISLQNYNSISNSESTTIDGNTSQVEKQMSTTGNDERIGTNGRIFMLYRTRLGKPGRTLTINGGGSWSTNNSWNKPLYTFTIPSDSTYMRDIERLSSSNSVRGEITYTEPLSKSSQLDVEYEFRHQFSDQNMVTDVFVNEVLNEELGKLLSNISESGYSLHQIGPGFNYSTQKVKFFAKVNYQYSSLDSKQILPQGAHPHYTFQDVTYTGNATINFNKQNMLRLRFRSNTNNPSIDQLQDAITVSGNTYTEGNPNLKPSYSHQFNAFYTNTNIEKGRTFMIHGGVWGSTRAIINSSIMNQPDFVLEKYDNQLLGAGNTYTKYENYYDGGNWHIYSGISYGFPLSFIKSNITFRANANFSNSPSKLNGEVNIMKGQYYNGGAQLSSNISENLDFSMAYNVGYNINDNNNAIASRQNRYFNQWASAELKWVAWGGFTFTANATYSQYKGITDDYNEEYLLCNAFIGKKLFKDRRGELSIGVNDIFDQNKDFRRSVGTNYLSNTTNLAIGRYVAVQFVYNLRIFGNGSTAKDFDNLQGGPGGGGRRMGPHGMRPH
ncbi:MAG: outer membrane beta-barrel protein [Tidjanibacter sp.]|nr:outer membrane beta-barrel protein [Tidjanibacter sp.]